MDALNFHMKLMRYQSSTPESTKGVEVLLSLPIDVVPVTGLIYREGRIVLLSDTKYPPINLYQLNSRISRLLMYKSNLEHEIVASVRDLDHEIKEIFIKRNKVIIKCL